MSRALTMRSASFVTTMSAGTVTGLASPFLVGRHGFDSSESGLSAADFLDDFLGWLVPDEGLGIVVPALGPDLDRFDEIGRHGGSAARGY